MFRENAFFYKKKKIGKTFPSRSGFDLFMILTARTMNNENTNNAGNVKTEFEHYASVRIFQIVPFLD